jgi:hypothetical protein
MAQAARRDGRARRRRNSMRSMREAQRPVRAQPAPSERGAALALSREASV